MKAIILAAGKGERMQPLTFKTPKPLLSVLGKPLLYHLVSQFPKAINELIIVVGYLGGQVKKYCGTELLGRRVKYVEQKSQRGTYHALELCKPLLKDDERFFVFYADDLIDKKTLTELLNFELAVSISEVRNPQSFGVVTLRGDGTIETVIEKPENPQSNLTMVSAHILNSLVFNYEPVRTKGEHYLSTAISGMAKEHLIYAVRANFWFPIASPEDIKKAEELLKR